MVLGDAHLLKLDNFQDLMSEMSDKIDASASRSLRGLEPTEASGWALSWPSSIGPLFGMVYEFYMIL